MLHRFYEDPTMIAYGEENRDWGGAFAVYRGLTEALPYHRLFNTSISEGAIVGSAVGYALCGGRVVPELMYCDFMGRLAMNSSIRSQNGNPCRPAFSKCRWSYAFPSAANTVRSTHRIGRVLSLIFRV
jgi:hypothetical protein